MLPVVDSEGVTRAPLRKGEMCRKMKQLSACLSLDTADVQCWGVLTSPVLP